MSDFFGELGDFVVTKMGIPLSSRLGEASSFFVEDTIKIFFLIYIMLFIVSLFRAQLNPDKIKQYLSGKTRFYGYILAVFLGVVTPFCSCSSIPLFLTFIAAGIPFGIAMAFLIASPLISEVAAVLLMTMPEAGVPTMLAYILSGGIIAVIGGWLCDKFKLERLVKPIEAEVEEKCHCKGEKNIQERVSSTIAFANGYAIQTVKEIWLYVLIGLGIGAIMHGYVPQELFVKYLGAENVLAVPIAAVAGIPIYANHNSVLPIVQVLLMKGVPIGTTLVMLMSITAISLPEMIMLNKVLSWKMLGLFIAYLFVAFIFVGYFINFLQLAF